jgi:iron complex outermembrane receptor protein
MLQNRRLRLKIGVALGLLLGLGVCSVFAQTATLKGKVTDSQTGEGLPQAAVQVTASGVQSGAATDVGGMYTVPNLAAGTYTVTTTYVGYDRRVQTVTLSAGETKVLNISLSGSGIELNPVVISASRRQEKILDAPASVSVLEATQIRGRATTTPTDYLRGMPAVDISSNGIAQSNVVVRGFNNIFSTTLLSLTDNRYANVPSLRLNAYNFIPLTAEDISRIEVVLGPGAALYGPNSSNGVMHIITRSPFESPGTIVSVGGGGRDFFNFGRSGSENNAALPAGGRNIFMGGFRHAGQLSDKIGIKISGQYYRGQDWENFEGKDANGRDIEPRTVRKFRPTVTGADSVGERVSNARDFQVEKFAGEARLDFRLTDNATLIFNSGYNQADQIELTGIGAAQGIDWGYYYGQARFSYKNLFLQAFVNGNSAGDTYIRRTGQLIIDKSKLYVGQIQHSYALKERQRFTYGLDALLTRPNSEGSIYGRNDNEKLNELGVYLQSETKLHPNKLDLVAAARVDDNNFLQDPVFSPRAALIFKPNSNNTLRLTYNRAFNTQSPLDLFLDILQQPVANPFAPLGQIFNPQGYSIQSNLLTVRARGVPHETGFTFRRVNGVPQMQSQFDRNPGYADPRLTNEIWTALRTGLVASNPALANLLPATLGTTGIDGLMRNIVTQQPLTADQIKNVEPVRPSITNTVEVGYKGVIANKLLLSIDLYATRIKDRVGALKNETPAVFANPDQLTAILGPYIVSRLVAGGVPLPQAQAQAAAIITQIASIPFGVISPEQSQNDISKDTDAYVTYRNFGKVTVNGMDLSLFYNASANWALGMNYSFVTKNGFNFFKKPNRVIFRNVDNTGNNIALNAAGNKVALSIQYRVPQRGYDVELRGRYIEGFPQDSGVYVGEVQTYSVFDLNWGYDLPFSKGTRWSINALNILDKKHREFIGAPIIGRLILTRLTQTL